MQFGIMCNSNELCAWQELVIQKLLAENHVQLKLVIFQNYRDNNPSTALQKTIPPCKSGFLWNLYNRYLVIGKSKALKKVVTSSLFKETSQISCDLIFGDDGFARLEDRDIQKIEDSGLDFILNFTLELLQGKIIKSAKFGVWSFQFSDPEKYSGSPACFWEIFNQDLLTRACLIKLSEDPSVSILLKEGYIKTHVVYRENIDNIHFEVASWPTLVCRELRINPTKNSESSVIAWGKDKLYPPGNSEMLLFLFIQFKLFIKKAYRKFFYTDYWNIGIVFSPIQEFLNSGAEPVVLWFPNLPKVRFMADPFGIYYQGKQYILYEDFRFDQGIGKTASVLLQNNSFLENKIVIDENFHMSYPFVLEYEEDIYCIPETYQNNQVRLYKADEFPYKWKLEKVLIENYAGIDNTPYFHEGKWYLFSTNKNMGVHHNLNIHHADTIFGPWQEHPGNPVKTDIRSARPAGTLFKHNGSLFRPSMDYSEKVEGRIVINKILTLTADDFKEEMHNIVYPFKNTFFSDKVHTISEMGPFTLVDGARELFVLSNFHALKYKLNKVLKRLYNN